MCAIVVAAANAVAVTVVVDVFVVVATVHAICTTLVANCRFSRHATINNNATLSNSRCAAY